MSLTLIIGPMFSSKTTTLIAKIQRYELAKNKCLIIKWANDNRYTNESVLITHHGISFPADLCKLSLMDSIELAEKYDVIGIDEGQFFADIYDFCVNLVNKGKKVIVSALNGDCRMRNFGNIYLLYPFAEEIIKLNAVCMKCHQDAHFTYRQMKEARDCASHNPSQGDGPTAHPRAGQIVIGGAELYFAVCRKCFNNCDQMIEGCKDQ